MRREIFLLFSLVILSMCIRSIYFGESLNFSTDQALFSMRALEIWQNKEITLIGPPISLQLEGRQIFQGGAIYYFQLLFLLIGNFDPLRSTYAFSIFSCLMLIPLYYGVKMLSDKRVALFVSLLYAMLPLYITYTKFLWNPNFQFSLIPIVLFFLGLYIQMKKNIYLFLFSVMLGFITQFHFQGFIVSVLAIILLCLLNNSITIKDFFIIFIGFLTGISNLLLFELRNQFYNTQTFMLFLQNFLRFSQKNSSSLLKNPHYFLSILLMIIIIGAVLLRKRFNLQINIFLFCVLFFISMITFTQKPIRGFGMAENWQYADELKTYGIIKENKIQDYNIVNLIYDTKATVQKYLHRSDNMTIKEEDYSNNQYLFVIDKDNKYLNDPAYEVNTFKPSKVVKQWNINKSYQLYLLKRL